MNDINDEYIREGDIALIDSKDKNDNRIYEVKIMDISPSGKYLKVATKHGHDPRWVHMNRYLETIVALDADESEYQDVDETAQDILEKIRNRNGSSPKPKDDSEVIHLDQFSKYDERNKRK